MKRKTARKRAAAEQPDRFLHLHVQEARAELRRKLKRAVDALDALQVAEDELIARWSAFALTRPTEPARTIQLRPAHDVPSDAGSES
jgi:hypothetical protein